MSGQEDETGKPTLAGYAIGLVFLCFIAGGVVLALRSGEEPPGSAHISSSSGSSNGLAPDNRVGTTYPGPQMTDLESAARVARCVVRENLPDEGNDHLTTEEPVPDYGTTPPTSGDHISPPLQQADGAWADPAAQVNVVHALEHGRIAIQYDPSLPESAQLELKGLYDTAYSAALLFPNPEMPYAAAATSWRNLIVCPDWKGRKTLDAIRAFGVEHQGNSPEPMNWFPSLDGPSFASPST
ncbi:MAG TPA: DUF3105 domain-containing protein [Solirubrobacterales bacterium]|nr:DUF3105 domain-containing protein [Solirubrobacterales bacterium]